MIFETDIPEPIYERIIKAQFMELGFTPDEFYQMTIDDIGDYLSYTKEKNQAEKLLMRQKAPKTPKGDTE